MLRTRTSSTGLPLGNKLPDGSDALHRPVTLAPLSDEELEELDIILASSTFGAAMDVEALDGFFSALLAGPEVSKPCEYWPVVLGKSFGDPATLECIRKTTVLLPLLARHWEAIAQTLRRGGVHSPYLLLDQRGVALGRNWARGFLQAVELHIEGWYPLINNDEHAAALLPMMMLAHDGDPNPVLRPPPLSDTHREELVRMMAAGLIRAHRYFGKPRTSAPPCITPNLH